jgi:hypothetical protein
MKYSRKLDVYSSSSAICTQAVVSMQWSSKVSVCYVKTNRKKTCCHQTIVQNNEICCNVWSMSVIYFLTV